MESPGRKFVITAAQLLLLTGLPLLYKHIGISDEITLTVLISATSAVGLYNVANVWQKIGASRTPPAP